MPSILELLDQTPGASPTGSNGQSAGEESGSRSNTEGHNGQAETVKQFSPAVRDRVASDDTTSNGSAGTVATHGQTHSKVRGRLAESIEDGRSIGTRAGSGFEGNTLFRHTPASQRIQQQRDAPTTSTCTADRPSCRAGARHRLQRRAYLDRVRVGSTSHPLFRSRDDCSF